MNIADSIMILGIVVFSVIAGLAIACVLGLLAGRIRKRL